jgi:hypothetical protein
MGAKFGVGVVATRLLGGRRARWTCGWSLEAEEGVD